MTTTNMFLNFGGKWDSPPDLRLIYFGELQIDNKNTVLMVKHGTCYNAEFRLVGVNQELANLASILHLYVFLGTGQS